MNATAPQRLGKYEIVREIGRGSMGTVHLGYDPFMGTEVAVKVAHPESLQDRDSGHRYRKLFFNEVKAAAMLKHPNIITVLDANVEGDTWYIVMEYVRGGHSLHVHCKPDKLLPMEDVVRIIAKCAKTLDFAHRKGVVHRDVKPKNILLTDTNEVKIGDFSIALLTQLDDASTQIHGYVGSPLYMSPEQIRDEEVTNQTDVFALGVVMYELLTGRHPFAAAKLPAVSHNILHRKQTPLRELRSDAPRILEHIVNRALAKDPARRYKSGLDLAANLSLVFDRAEAAQEDISAREKFNLVRNLDFFADFSEPEVWEVINAAAWQQFNPGSQIITEGEADDSFYVIVSGSVMVRKGDMDLQMLERGDCFAEMAFIARAKRSATIVARTPVSVLKVRGSLIEHTSLGCQLRFHKIFLHTMVARLSRATEWIYSIEKG